MARKQDVCPSEERPTLAWDDFRLVKEIAEARGLTGAAEALGINHSTAFRRLGQIEGTLGTALFERHRGGYVPSPAGREMIEVAARLDTDITAFGRRLAGRDLSVAGELRVTTNDSLLAHLLTPLLAAFRAARPEIRLDILVSNDSLNLSRRDADVAIRATDRPPDSLVGRRLATIAWAAYARRDDEAARDPAIWPERCWTGLAPGLAGPWAGWFAERRIPPERVGYRLSSVGGLAEAIEAGIGIGHLPCFVGDTRPSLIRLAPPETDLSAGLWLLTHPDLRAAPRVRVFLDAMAAAIRSKRALIEGRTAR